MGCRDATKSRGTFLLRETGKSLPDFCAGVDDSCQNMGISAYQRAENGRGWYDIGHPKHDPFPPPTMHGYLMDESVLAALGVPVNFTTSSRAVYNNFG